jgi:excisionase family DNA binding protein
VSALHVEVPVSATERLVFSVPEVAELLGISRAFAYELVARGELPVVRLGRRVVVPRVALLAKFGAVGTSGR